jgi:hypothetical protein
MTHTHAGSALIFGREISMTLFVPSGRHGRSDKAVAEASVVS